MTIARVLLAAAFTGVLSHAGSATPLDKETCEQIKTELVAMGAVKDHIAKGPEWGKANLSAEQLKNVERYIQLEEQVAFRCVVRKPPVEAAAAKAPRPKANKAAAKSSDGVEKDADAVKEAPVKTAAPKPKPKPKVAPPSDQQGSIGAEPIAGKATPPPAKKAPAPKPKVNDAFVPPGSSSQPVVKQ